VDDRDRGIGVILAVLRANAAWLETRIRQRSPDPRDIP
jgi:hypothetical protein